MKNGNNRRTHGSVLKYVRNPSTVGVRQHESGPSTKWSAVALSTARPTMLNLGRAGNKWLPFIHQSILMHCKHQNTESGLSIINGECTRNCSHPKSPWFDPERKGGSPTSHMLQWFACCLPCFALVCNYDASRPFPTEWRFMGDKA